MDEEEGLGEERVSIWAMALIGKKHKRSEEERNWRYPIENENQGNRKRSQKLKRRTKIEKGVNFRGK